MPVSGTGAGTMPFTLPRLLAACLLWTGLLLAAHGAWARPQPLVLDSDMAIDDWSALLYVAKHPGVRLIGATVTGAGEAHCAAALANLPRLLDLVDAPAELPYACGDDAPSDGYFVFPAPWRRQADTLSGVALPPSRRQPVGEDAVTLLHRLISGSAQPVILLATGPLTNVAAWLDRYPADRPRLARLVIMGGALDVPGNIVVPGFTDGWPNRDSEWNLFVDASAARKVLTSRLPITLVPLDATRHVPVTDRFTARFKEAARTPAARFVDAVFDRNREFVASGEYYLWDVLAAIIAAEPGLCRRGDRLPLTVDAQQADTPFAAAEDASLPPKRVDGHRRRHLQAATAGRTRAGAQGPLVHVCQQTRPAEALERFLQVLNRR